MSTVAPRHPRPMPDAVSLAYHEADHPRGRGGKWEATGGGHLYDPASKAWVRSPGRDDEGPDRAERPRYEVRAAAHGLHAVVDNHAGGKAVSVHADREKAVARAGEKNAEHVGSAKPEGEKPADRFTVRSQLNGLHAVVDGTTGGAVNVFPKRSDAEAHAASENAPKPAAHPSIVTAITRAEAVAGNGGASPSQVANIARARYAVDAEARKAFPTAGAFADAARAEYERRKGVTPVPAKDVDRDFSDAYREAYRRPFGLSRRYDAGGEAWVVDLSRHSYSSTQVNLSPELAADVLKLAREVDDDDLAEDGRETEPHVTVKYGLHTSDPTEVRKALAGGRGGKAHWGSVDLSLGDVSLFTGGDADVVKIDVDSPTLHALNGRLSSHMEHTTTHPDYKPHATIAYVKPGKGAKYVGKLNRLKGRTDSIDRIRFSDKDGVVTDIPLKSASSLSRFDGGAKAWLYVGDAAPPLGPVSLSTRQPGNPVEVPAALEGRETTDKRTGAKVSWWWKDALSLGRYVHPNMRTPDGNRYQFDVTAERLKHWVKSFREMRKAGIRVPVVVDHSDRTEDARGTVEDMRVEGGKLRTLVRLVGDDAALAAERNCSSIQFVPSYTDAASHTTWADVVTHQSMTPLPVVAGLGPFEPIDGPPELLLEAA